MHGIELIIILLIAVIVLAILAFEADIPYPMVLLAGGTAIAFIPGMPHVQLEPDLIFVLFLPPILFSAAYFTSWRDFWSNRRPIGLLAIGGVLSCMTAVAIVAWWLIPDVTWPVAFLIGAIVSPPDAVAATSIFQRLGVPSRIVTILEGESLINDASALIAFRFALAAVVAGSFSIWEASMDFVLVAVSGTIIGFVAGWLLARIVAWIPDASLVIATTLVTPLGVYLLAETLHVSGVLAAVTAGLCFSRWQSARMTPQARSGGKSVWRTGILIINCLVFILMGLQVGEILDNLESRNLSTLLWQSLVISLVVILARFLWVFPATYIPRWLFPSIRRDDPLPQNRAIFVIAWSGLRGIVSLASALAVPLTLDDGTSFPFRNETIFITFVVIVVTLLGQGSALPWILRRLHPEDDGQLDSELIYARRLAATAVLNRLDELEGLDWVPLGHVIELRTRFSHALEHLPESGRTEDFDDDHLESHDRLRDEVFGSARNAVIASRNRSEIGDEARVNVELELDLELLRKEF